MNNNIDNNIKRKIKRNINHSVDTNKFKKKSSKLILFEVLSVLIIIGLIGYTYSYFSANATNSSVIYGEAASVNVSLTVTKVAPDNSKGLVPQLSEYITSAITGRNGNCIDDNDNNVCQVYKITVKNNSATTLYVNGRLTIDAKNNPNLKWAKISGITSPTLESSVNDSSYKPLIQEEYYNSNETRDYYIVIWISETETIQTDQGGFSGVVTIGDVSSIELPDNPEDTLTRLNLTLNTDTPDFRKTSCSSGCMEATVGLFKYTDDFGTSYYFRGNVENNYVLFAGFYWRIIRINGDGTIRMIYDGTSAHNNGETSTDRDASKTLYNTSAKDNAYVGYMYGVLGASTYDQTHSNINNSLVKEAVDTWYSTNIVGTAYEEYVVDAIYCNDREISTAYSDYTGKGYGTYGSSYMPRERLVMHATPSLKCTQVNDRFTKKSSLYGVDGNGMLTYPVGLITADEVMLAGGTTPYANSKFYLYSSSGYWTMTPSHFTGTLAYEYNVANKVLLYGAYVDGSNNGVRPVISISPSAITSGTGLKTNPFKTSLQ